MGFSITVKGTSLKSILSPTNDYKLEVVITVVLAAVLFGVFHIYKFITRFVTKGNERIKYHLLWKGPNIDGGLFERFEHLRVPRYFSD